jgi:DNA-binding response OmpR family regulator
MSGDTRRTVLLVEDEELLLETYRVWLEDEYDLRTALDGDEALELIDEDVDVVVLDRRMPTLSGDETLAEMRDRGYDCRVAMVTAVDPDIDIIEMPFDAYVTKPIQRETLVEAIERLGEVATNAAAYRELFSVVEKRAALETELSPRTLEESDEYRRLVERYEELSAAVDESIGAMDRETLETVYRDMGDRGTEE